MTYNPICPRCQAPLLASTVTLYNRNICPCDWPPVFREVTPQQLLSNWKAINAHPSQ